MTEDLVLLASFEHRTEAEVVASLLDSAGIDVLVDRPFLPGVRPDWLFGRERPDDGVRLYVRREDEARAREMLDARPEESS